MRRLNAAWGAMPAGVALLAAAPAAPAAAATRSFIVTYFDHVRLTGPFKVAVATGPGPSAQAEGSARALDRVRAEVQGQTLVLQLDRIEAGSDVAPTGPIAITLTTPALVGATVLGPGTLAVDKLRGGRVDLTLSGSGRIQVGALAADKLNLLIAGSGSAAIAGKAAQLRLVTQGSGPVDLGKLDVADAEVAANGTGDVTVNVSRAAKGSAEGSGNVAILGSGACAVASNGAGTVTCHPAPAAAQ